MKPKLAGKKKIEKSRDNVMNKKCNKKQKIATFGAKT